MISKQGREGIVNRIAVQYQVATLQRSPHYLKTTQTEHVKVKSPNHRLADLSKYRLSIEQKLLYVLHVPQYEHLQDEPVINISRVARKIMKCKLTVRPGSTNVWKLPSNRRPLNKDSIIEVFEFITLTIYKLLYSKIVSDTTDDHFPASSFKLTMRLNTILSSVLSESIAWDTVSKSLFKAFRVTYHICYTHRLESNRF